jgi:4,5-dihydroxyphthalate decarboxylase
MPEKGQAMHTLITVLRDQGNNLALKDGEVAPRGYTLKFTEVPVIVDAFRRMVRGLEFDVCEMAMTTYLCAKAYGKPFTALPVFLVRGFHHGAIVRGAEVPLRPKDLQGRRVGVNRGYTVTTGVWVRGILADEYGLDLNSVTWVRSGDEHVAEYRPPSNVVSMPADATLDGLLASGDLAAAIGVDGAGHDVAPLIPDAAAAGFAALAGRGHYPINHLVVVKDELLGAHPELAAELFRAFSEAKIRYVDRLRHYEAEAPNATDRMYQQVMQLTGRDPLPYGIAPNRAVIEELIRHAMSQGILDRRPEVESLFADGTRELEG